MSNTVRNIIAIAVGAVAAAGIIAVIAMAVITVSPASYGKYVDASGAEVEGKFFDYDAVDIYYAGERLPVTASGELQGAGAESGKHTVGDVLDRMNFSLFSTAIVFNYDYGVTFYDNSRIRNNELSAGELRTVIEGYKSAETWGYVFEISNRSVQTLKVTDAWGRSAELDFDTVVFCVEPASASDWPVSIECYAFVRGALYSTSDMPGENADSYRYYRLRFSGKTSDLVSLLDGIYDIDSSADPAEKAKDETAEDGEEESGEAEGDSAAAA